MFGFFKKNQVEKEVPVFALAGGEIVPITQVNDPVFAGKMMGDGFAVIPSSGVITSPVKGEVVNVFPTLHAVGIQTAGGLEVLVHMGIDTVELKGGPFETTVAVGQKVDEHTVLSTVDLEALKEAEKKVSKKSIKDILGGFVGKETKKESTFNVDEDFGKVSKSNSLLPKTGLNNNVTVYTGIAVLALVGLTVYVKRRKQK